METATLARPYARAAFDLAREHQTLDEWSAQLAVAAAIAADPRMAALGTDPEVGAAELARLHRPNGVSDGAQFARFLDAMADNRRLSLLPQVASHFDSLRRAAERSVKVRMRFAEQPEQAQLDKLVEALRVKLDQRIELDVEVTPEILGGAIIDIDGEVLDGSVRAQLQQLQTALTH